MICFYHKSDLDGHCSGAIVKDYYPDCEMIGIDYGDEFPWERVKPLEVVFMVDFSLPEADMRRLSNLAVLHWIDHHKTAIDWAVAGGFWASGGQLLEIGEAACELTWRYLRPDEPMPEAVYLLGRYDVWKHHEVENALEFQYGMRLRDTDPSNRDEWAWLFWHKELCVMQVVRDGRMVLLYEDKQNAKYADGYAFELAFEGLRFVALNRGCANSKAFDAVYDSEMHDAMMLFCFNGQSWKVSLYSDKESVDVSAIAKKYGGGGHKGAAGFHCESLPFSVSGR